MSSYRQEINLFIRLTRWNDWILNIGFILTGFFLSRPESGLYTLLLPMVVVFFFVESFGFAINDYFDAPFDKLKPATNNVISKGLLKKSDAAVFIIFLLFFGLTFSFLYLPTSSFFLIAALYLVFFAYSSPPFRLKEKVFLGITAHGIGISVILLASYLITSPLQMSVVLLSFIAIAFFLSILVCITQEVRDMNPDRKAKFRTTAIALGYRRSLTLIRATFLLANVIFFVTVILYLPLYMLLLMAGSVFYLKLLFSNPPQRTLFQKTLRSWDKGIAVAFITGLIMLPFYLGIV